MSDKINEVKKENVSGQDALLFVEQADSLLIANTLSRMKDKHIPVIIGDAGTGFTSALSLMLARSCLVSPVVSAPCDAIRDIHVPMDICPFLLDSVKLQIVSHVSRFQHDASLREHTNSLLSSSSIALLKPRENLA